MTPIRAAERNEMPKVAVPHVIATDMGGTFVDAVVIDGAGNVSYGKAPVTPDSPDEGLFAAIADAIGVPVSQVAEYVAACERFLHGTTVTTNAMIERSGGPTALLITRGFEDTLPIGRVIARTVGLDEAALMDRRRIGTPAPVVPASLTRGISERIDYRGRVLCPLDPDEVERVVAELLAAGVRSIAVCLLSSFQNAAHERWIREFIRTRHPDVHVTVSSDLIPAIGEYERANTTAVNAYLQPVFDRYVAHLEHRLAATGAPGKLQIMQSIGGLAPAQEVRSTPVTTLYSGPVGGVMAARRLGELIGEPNLITTDMGGTSFDVGLIVDGEAQFERKSVIERNLLLVPAVQVATIGAGGGSVAWLDAADMLRVGPRSQGSVPGPVCYQRGGVQPTVTDAAVVLGYVNPDRFLGGRFALDRAAAVEAIERELARPLGIGVTEAAAAVYAIVNARMADLIRRVSVGRGYDPRDFALVAFGGCGPTHVAGYAPDIGVRRIIVPFHAPVFSAFGIGTSDMRRFYAGSVHLRIERESAAGDDDDRRVVEETFQQMIGRAREQAGVEADLPGSAIELSVDMHYDGQVNELTVPIDVHTFETAEGVRDLCEDFRRRYEQRYGVGSSSQIAACEVTMARVSAVVRSEIQPSPVPISARRADGTDGFVGNREVYWPAHKAYLPTPIYRGEDLAIGQCVSGPTVIEMYATSVPLHPGQTLEVDRWRNLVIRS
jgi:N-methylhydantoinase A